MFFRYPIRYDARNAGSLAFYHGVAIVSVMHVMIVVVPLLIEGKLRALKCCLDLDLVISR